MINELKSLGHSVKDCCEALGIARSNYYRHKASREGKIIDITEMIILDKIKAIKLEHPFWGYRRVRAWLVHREGLKINEKKVKRIMKENGLLVNQKVYKAKRTANRSKPKATRPNQFFGIDMTKFLVTSVGWVYLVIVLDWYSKKIVGWDISTRSKTAEWKNAVEMAVNNQFPQGVRGQGLKLVSDNGCQPTSGSFMKEMAELEIEQIFTSYNNPKGNAETERMMRTIKEEVVWLNEFESFEEAKMAIEKWIEKDYNKLYPHSALQYKSPEEFEKKYYQSELKLAA